MDCSPQSSTLSVNGGPGSHDPLTSPSHGDPPLIQHHSCSSKDAAPENPVHKDGGKEGTALSGKDRDNMAAKRRTSYDTRKRTSESASIDDGDEPEGLPLKKRPLLSDSGDSGVTDSIHGGDSGVTDSIHGGDSGVTDSIHGGDSAGLSVEQLVERVHRLKRKGLLAEYAAIRKEPHAGTFHHSRARPNLPKNRYTDVLCYDHSRVTLPLRDGDPSSHYINANFVDGYRHKSAYIATQGPLTKTFGDFWRMVWEQQCRVIVMTTRTVERQRVKCGQYWPAEEGCALEHEEFVVSNSNSQLLDNYSHTTLSLHNTKTGETREITHLQFTSWPDHGVPPADGFLDFLMRVRAQQAAHTHRLGSSWSGHPLGPPIVVHCSAGIGRSGTFITIDICLRRLEDVGTVEVGGTVRGVRSQRAFSIQTPEQYVFCHLGVIQHAVHCGHLSSVSLDLSDGDSD